MTTSIPLRVFIFTSALKNTSEKGENWWRELRDIHFSMIAEKPRKIKVFQRWASKKGIRFRVRLVMTTSITLPLCSAAAFPCLFPIEKDFGKNWRKEQQTYSISEPWKTRVVTRFLVDETDNSPQDFESAPLWPLRYVCIYPVISSDITTIILYTKKRALSIIFYLFLFHKPFWICSEAKIS